MMIIDEEVICKTCEKVFCCVECREKHELKTHAIVVHCIEPVLHLFCPICQKKPLLLHAVMRIELLAHISENHLPLCCQKCSRLYTKHEDLLDFSKCTQNNASCKLEISENVLPQIKKESTPPPQKNRASSVSTQTSPICVPEINDSHLTPISMMNLRWKTKSKVGGFTGDSVSSIKNISSIDNSSSRKSTGIYIPIVKGKLVRSTSTPLQAEIFAKAKEQVFNVSGGHVSSIYNSASEPESSPPLVLPVGTPSTRATEIVNRHHKPRCRGKISKAVTPLRQVMSKSIQKAIAEHGMATGTRATGLYPKKMFDSADTSTDVSERATDNFPLDLRLSPALRRTQSEIIQRKSHLELLHTLSKPQPNTLRREILLSSTKKTTESIVITSTSSTAESERSQNAEHSSNSVYQTCRSVEIITSTSTKLSEVNLEQNDIILESNVSGIPPITPRIPTSGVLINKKIIKFETPVVVQGTEKENSDELFFTPSSTPVRASKERQAVQYKNSGVDTLLQEFCSMDEREYNKTKSLGSDYTDVAFDDEVFDEDKKPEQSKSKLWSLVASVMRLPSLNARSDNSNSTSLIRRCASFAGSLVKQKCNQEESQAVKRKRTYTADSQLFQVAGNSCTDSDVTCSDSKRFRIHPRKPIQRMRQNVKKI